MGSVHASWESPLAGRTLTSIFPGAQDGMTVLPVDSEHNQLHVSGLRGWGWVDDEPHDWESQEFFVVNPVTNAVQYTFAGYLGQMTRRVFRRAIRSLPRSGCTSSLRPPGQSDVLTTNNLGGYSVLPCSPQAFRPESDRQVQDEHGYHDQFYLTNSAGWYQGTTKTNVPIYLGEGFWINPADQCGGASLGRADLNLLNERGEDC